MNKWKLLTFVFFIITILMFFINGYTYSTNASSNGWDDKCFSICENKFEVAEFSNYDLCNMECSCFNQAKELIYKENVDLTN